MCSVMYSGTAEPVIRAFPRLDSGGFDVTARWICELAQSFVPNPIVDDIRDDVLGFRLEEDDRCTAASPPEVPG